MTTEEARRETERALQEAERDNRRAIAAALALVFLLSRPSSARGLSLAAGDLERNLALILPQARARAARDGRRTLAGELAALGLSGALVQQLDRDTDRQIAAGAIAAAYARAWLEAAREAYDDGATARQAANAATKAQRWRVDMVATTETSVAFNEARIEYAADLSAVGLPLWLEWVAELDACPRCWALDGDRVLATEGFDRSPGSIHPNCRCYAVVTTS